MMKKYRDAKRLRGECLNDARKARPGKLYCEHCAIQSNERQARYRIRRLYPYLDWPRERFAWFRDEKLDK
jgi:hypothetical protein